MPRIESPTFQAIYMLNRQRSVLIEANINL